jgi:tetratricopeptide (TPR) repeat protein
MGWPTPQDYNEAIQNPAACLRDAALQHGAAATDRLGLPRPVSGAFASVYHFNCSKSEWAVRCFLHPIHDQEERYEALSDYIDHDDLQCTVPFTFLPEGIRIHNEWFPLLKMEWVKGRNLNAFIEKYLASSSRISALADSFKSMCADLDRAGIAHGDLQHGNIMVLDDGSLRLVDYDGMFVPALRGCQSNELGHRNYQHPQRNKNHFGAYLDNFSAWTIYTSLRALAVQPSLWAQLKGGDECLLLRQTDYQDPLASPAFSHLEHHPDKEIAHMAKCIRYFLTLPVEQVPGLNATVDFPSFMPELPTVEEAERRRSENDERRFSAASAACAWYADEANQGGGTATRTRTQTSIKTGLPPSSAHSSAGATYVSAHAQHSTSPSINNAPTQGYNKALHYSLGKAKSGWGRGPIAAIFWLVIFFAISLFVRAVSPSANRTSAAMPALMTRAESHYQLGVATAIKADRFPQFRNEKSLTQAISDLNQAIKTKFTDSASAHYYRGVAYDCLGEYENAIIDFDYAEQDERKNAKDRIEKPKDSEQGFPVPTAADIYFKQGLANMGLLKYETAAARFTLCLKQGPYPPALFDRSLSHYRAGKFNDALTDINSYIAQQYKQIRSDRMALTSAQKLRAAIQAAMKHGPIRPHHRRA